MKLYYSPGACSLASHIVLTETGAKFATEPVNLKTHHFKGGDFYKTNPKGYVPALELDNGQLLTEGAVILQYIADQKPDSSLMPKAGTMERYRAQEWLNYVATEVHKNFGPLWNDKTPVEYRAMVVETLGKKCDFLASHLKTNQFLMGATFTSPDAYLFTVLNWSPMVKFDLTKWPELLAYMERVKQRPAVQTAMKAEGLLK